MGFKYREKFLTEKCLNSITHHYRENLDYHSALQDFEIDFCQFLAQNEKQYVDYGIEYMYKNYPEETQLLEPLIWEYRTNGTKDSLSWDPIPDKAVTNPIYSEDNGCECGACCDENGELVEETKQYESGITGNRLQGSGFQNQGA